MHIALGTKNEAKAKWLQDAIMELSLFDAVYPDYSYHSVDSWVSDTPLSLAETVTGATNRAKRLYEDENIIADYYVWLEWAVMQMVEWWAGFIFWYVHVIDARGRSHGGFSPLMELPKSITRKLYEDGKDLGDIAREISWDDQISHTLWSFWYFSDRLMTRDESFKIATKMAFVPFGNTKYI